MILQVRGPDFPRDGTVLLRKCRATAHNCWPLQYLLDPIGTFKTRSTSFVLDFSGRGWICVLFFFILLRVNKWLYNWWFGLVVWISGISLWKGLLFRAIYHSWLWLYFGNLRMIYTNLLVFHKIASGRNRSIWGPISHLVRGKFSHMVIYGSIFHVAGVCMCVSLKSPSIMEGLQRSIHVSLSDFTYTHVFKNQLKFQGITVSTSTYIPTNGS